jgi:hypothetical protein
MSDPSKFEYLRKQAKTILKQCRAGDAEALGRIRAQLPRFAELSDALAAYQIKLADVHHALARERGHANWAELKREDAPLEQFLVAVRGFALKDAQRVLAAFHEMAAESVMPHAPSAIPMPLRTI